MNPSDLTALVQNKRQLSKTPDQLLRLCLMELYHTGIDRKDSAFVSFVSAAFYLGHAIRLKRLSDNKLFRGRVGWEISLDMKPSVHHLPAEVNFTYVDRSGVIPILLDEICTCIAILRHPQHATLRGPLVVGRFENIHRIRLSECRALVQQVIETGPPDRRVYTIQDHDFKVALATT